MRIGHAVLCVLLAAAAAHAQDEQAAKANEVWNSGNQLAALPYYEELAKAHPGEWVYSERLAVALVVKAHFTEDVSERRELLTRAREAAEQAVKDNDPNYFIQQTANLDVEAALKEKDPLTPARKVFEDAEKAFGTGDYAKALTEYGQALDLDPTFYEAALYAGDAAYAGRDLNTAAKWFARAISINPDRETAYRYWGDAILRFGNDPDAAKEKYIQAIVADPYNQLAWQGVKNWAHITKGTVQAPRIELPAGPVRDPNDPKKVTINVNPNASDTIGGVWMSYQMGRALWINEKFVKEFPGQTYRHTLREEDDALSTALKVAFELKADRNVSDESLRNLLDLQQAGMLDCWILINGADEGIAQDYPAYRKDHRQLLHDYLERFVLHGGVAAAQQ